LSCFHKDLPFKLNQFLFSATAFNHTEHYQLKVFAPQGYLQKRWGPEGLPQEKGLVLYYNTSPYN